MNEKAKRKKEKKKKIQFNPRFFISQLVRVMSVENLLSLALDFRKRKSSIRTSSPRYRSVQHAAITWAVSHRGHCDGPAEFGCNACRKVLNQPVSVPCGHNFCKGCLDSVFAGQDTSRERKGVSGRSLRTQKIVKRCPNCKADITDFLVSPQV